MANINSTRVGVSTRQHSPFEKVDPETGEIFTPVTPINEIPAQYEEPDSSVDDFDGLFDGPDNSDVVIQLERKEPKMFNRERIDGYLRTLSRDDSPLLETITQEYGGGLYQLRKRVNGKWEKGGSKTVRIAGPPRVGPPTTSAAASDTTEIPRLDGNASLNGIPLGGSDKEFAAVIQRVAIIRAMFPEPPKPVDVNQALLDIVLKGTGKQTEPIDQMLNNVEKLTEIADRLSSAGGNRADDSGLGLVKEVLGVFQQIAQAKQQPRPVAPAQQNPPQPAGYIPDTTSQTTEAPVIDFQGVAKNVLGVLVRSYLSQASITPDDCYKLIVSQYPQLPHARGIIKDYTASLWSMAVLELEELSDEPDIQAFKKYFDSVFLALVGAA